MNLLVTIPAESRRMNVGKDVIRVLGSPTYICVLQRKDRKSIAITPCTAEHPMSFKVPDRLLTDGQCRMMINGIQFICFSALERQEEKLSAEKAEIVKQRVALYEQYADGNMSKEEFIRQRDAYRAQEDEMMKQIQRLRTEKNQVFQPVKKDTDHLQTVISTVEEAGDVMHLSQNVVETFIDRIEVFNDERVKIHFTFENVLADYAE